MGGSAEERLQMHARVRFSYSVHVVYQGWPLLHFEHFVEGLEARLVNSMHKTMPSVSHACTVSQNNKR